MVHHQTICVAFPEPEIEISEEQIMSESLRRLSNGCRCIKTHEHKQKGFTRAVKRHTAYRRRNRKIEVDMEGEK